MQAISNLFQRFQQRLEAAGGEAHYAESLVGAADIIAAHPALAQREIVVPPAFEERQPWGAILPMLAERGIAINEAGDPASVADFPAGLSSAELAIAETGSILLAENALPARVVSMLTLTHFVLAQADALYPMLERSWQRAATPHHSRSRPAPLHLTRHRPQPHRRHRTHPHHRRPGATRPMCYYCRDRGWVPWRIIAGCSFMHYPDHVTAIREWLIRRGGGG